MEQVAIARTVAVAAGRFAPGHLGELTGIVPFEMVDAVLEDTRAGERRVRRLPARVTVYLLLAGALFADLGWGQVWDRLVAGLSGLAGARPTGSALRQGRQRVGAAPLKALFELLAGPAATTARQAVRFRGLLVVAIDGTTMSVPDSAANLAVFAKPGCFNGGGGYPQLRLVALVACGTRAVIAAVFGPATTGETSYAERFADELKTGMLLLADRNFAAAGLLGRLAAGGADLLVRVKSGRVLPPIGRLADGSHLARLGPSTVRVIDAEIAIATGVRTGHYRLVTTLLDVREYPALELVRLYHQRWEIETCYAEIKSTILGGRVLRARTPTGIDQEIWALLTAYQVLRIAMTDATDHRPGTDPDRASFTIALHAARDQLILAAGVIADTTIDLVGAIGRAVLANLLPDRRVRTNARTVKRAISKYNARGPNIDRTTYQATIAIALLPLPTTSPP